MSQMNDYVKTGSMTQVWGVQSFSDDIKNLKYIIRKPNRSSFASLSCLQDFPGEKIKETDFETTDF